MNLLDIHFFSDLFGMQTRMKVLLPDRMQGEFGHGLELKETRNFGALYLLHGMGNGYTAWTRWTNIEIYAASHNLAVIMPEADLGWYTDMKYGFPYFSFITEELPKVCHNLFPHLSAERKDTFVAGISMGGYGALRCALNRPDLYAGAGVFAGGFDIPGRHMNNETDTEEERRQIHDVFGTEEEYLQSDSNLYKVAEDRKNDSSKPRIFHCCGTKDPFYACNLKMRDTLKENGWDVTYTEGEAGHDFLYWNSELPSLLHWIDETRREG